MPSGNFDPFSHLATTDTGRKLGGYGPLGEGELDFQLTQCDQGRGLPACQVSSCSVQPFGHSAWTLQTDRTTVQWHRANRFTNGRPKMNPSTVKWAQWHKTQSKELLGLFICVCIALCTIVAHNIAQNTQFLQAGCPSCHLINTV